MSTSFVKLDRYYVNLDCIALVEEVEEIYMVRLNTSTKNIPEVVTVSKTTNEGLSLMRAIQERIAR